MIKSWKIRNKGYSESAVPTNTWNGSKKSDMNITIWDLAFKSNVLFVNILRNYSAQLLKALLTFMNFMKLKEEYLKHNLKKNNVP